MELVIRKSEESEAKSSRYNSPLLTAMKKLDVGFCVDVPQELIRDRSHAYILAKRLGIKISTRITEGGIAVHRIA